MNTISTNTRTGTFATTCGCHSCPVCLGDESANDEHKDSKMRTETMLSAEKERKIDLGVVSVDGIPSMLMPNLLRTQGILARVKRLKSISFMVLLSISWTGKEKKQ
jgi:hypothetical protein